MDMEFEPSDFEHEVRESDPKFDPLDPRALVALCSPLQMEFFPIGIERSI